MDELNELTKYLDERFEASIRAAVERRERKRAERAERATRRAYGLRARHHQKLAHLREREAAPDVRHTPGAQTKETTPVSLAIDVDHVTRVLIAGTWYDVANDSFNLDAYEYLWHASPDPDADPVVLQGGGQYGVCANGFSFTTLGGTLIEGPLTAIQAVESRKKDQA